MSETELTELGLASGIWRARLSGAGPAPEVDVTHQGAAVAGVTLEKDGGGWLLSVPVPAESLSDGVQTYLVTETASGARLGGFAIAAGAVLEADIRAEVELLRAELDILKKAFRRLAAKGG